MSAIRLQNDKIVGDYLKPYIVAELNTSHFGDIEIAKNMIREAKNAGCDCVKFQSWSTETLYSESYYKQNTIAKRIINKFSLNSHELEALSVFAIEIGIDFSSTPYSIEEAKFLVANCNVPFVKIASMELNNLPYLKQLAELNVPLVLSTGMGSNEEIIRAVQVIQSAGNNRIIILHCTSVYPSRPGIIRLNNILGLRSEFPEFPVGYSDHSIGSEIAAGSVALGACLIEKHFTLDNKRIGMDNQMATEPLEMKSMVDACHNVHAAMGGTSRILCNEEVDQKIKMRRSIIAKNFIKKGDIISLDNIDFKRPGTGIPPSELEKILGAKVLSDIESGSVLNLNDLSN